MFDYKNVPSDRSYVEIVTCTYFFGFQRTDKVDRNYFSSVENDVSFPQEITRTSQTYRRQNQSSCPACFPFLSRRARLPSHAQKMCAVTIVGTVLKRARDGAYYPIGTLRSDNGDVHENVAEKQTSHPFKIFRDYPNSPCY